MKRKPLKLADRKLHTENWKLIWNQTSQKATLEARTYWNNVFKILKGNYFQVGILQTVKMLNICEDIFRHRGLY